jgi:hypothetical protein
MVVWIGFIAAAITRLVAWGLALEFIVSLIL